MTNCAIVDYSPPLPADPLTDYKWISIYGISNRLDNCYFSGKTNMGATTVVGLTGQTNEFNRNVIRRNFFGHRPVLGVNGGETIRIGVGAVSYVSAQTLVEENYFQHCDGEIEMISNKSS